MKAKTQMVIILAVITALESLSIDLYLPAFTQIAQHFHTTIGEVQLSLSLFLAGFALGQLLWGPLSDRHGRKPVLLLGLAIFVGSSVAIHFVRYVEALWLLRFLQAFGGCAGIVMARAIVADLFPPEEAIGIFATQAQISGVAPILAPLLGSVLLSHWGWQSMFSVLSLLGAGCLVAVVCCVPESNTRPNGAATEHAQQPLGSLLKSTLANQQFVGFTLVGAMAYSALMLYISIAPFLFIEQMGLSEMQFGLVFGFNSLGLVFASYLTPKLTRYIAPPTLMVVAAVVLTGFCLGVAVAVLAGAAPVVLMALLFLSLIPIGILLPGTTALSLQTVTQGKVTASALMGCLQLLLSFVLSTLAGMWQHGSLLPMAWLRLLAGFVAIGLALWGVRLQKEVPRAVVPV